MRGSLDKALANGVVVTLKEHTEALRAADQRALEIKETADLAALELAREIQSYKDEKANNLRSQIESERGSYATKDDLDAAQDKFDAQLEPVKVANQVRQGGDLATQSAVNRGLARAGIGGGLLAASITVVSAILTHGYR